MKKSWVLYLILAIALAGLADATYLTYEHFSNILPPCHIGFFVDCGKVLLSKYSVMFGIPVALIGVFQYLSEAVLTLLFIVTKKTEFKKLLIIFSFIGLGGSIYFMFIQFVIIKSICLYCTLSALISFVLFYLIWWKFEYERKQACVFITKITYKYLMKPLLFMIDPEIVHEQMVSFGSNLGKYRLVRNVFDYFYYYENKMLSQKIAGIMFDNPVGLSAGFDYDAKLTQILPTISFGFMSVGTITNMPYGGNPAPMLGRLPKSKSLMVNKGFKSQGAEVISKKLKNLDFEIPVGVSIGRTNSSKLKTQKESVADIISAFKIFEKSGVKNAYYELNISCPNLIHAGNIEFYSPNNLEQLLSAVDKLYIKKPVFVKMPIDKTDNETLAMLKVIAKHSPAGVIFGNLQKDKNHTSLDKKEVAKFNVGNFSGKPTWERSNELVSLTYINYKKRFVIIGCGGIFSAEDAYEKIKRGASLVMLITGMIFEGPQIIADINIKLTDFLERDGFKNLSDAVGAKYS